MTEIQIKVTEGVTEIQIAGHAGHNVGPDVVCAACSVLAYTLIQSLLDGKHQGSIEELRYAEQIASVWIRFRPASRDDKAVEAMLNTILTGYALLEAQYPGHVKIKR